MKPGVINTNWYTYIRSLSLVSLLYSFQLFCCLLLHCRRISFAKRHALQVGMLQSARRLGMIFFAIFCNLANEMWPERCWYRINSEDAVVGWFYSYSSITTSLVELAGTFKLNSVVVG